MIKNRFENTGNKAVDSNLQDVYRLLNQYKDKQNELESRLNNLLPISPIDVNGKGVVYDDIQVALTSAKQPASSSPTWTTHDFGIASGVVYPVQGFGVGDYLSFYIQTSHSMQLNSVLDNHIHWTIPSAGVGDNFQFQLDVIAAGIGDDFAVPTGSPFTSEHTILSGDEDKHSLLELADIPEVNSTVSTVYLCRLTRIAATSDEYSSDVYVVFNDSHFKKNTVGSSREDAK